MRNIARTSVALAALLGVMSSCSSSPQDVGRDSAIYSAVITHWGPPVHHRGLVVRAICDGAAETPRGGCHPMADVLETAIDAKLGDDYRFIDDPSPETIDQLSGRATVYWVGPIAEDGDRVTVPASYFCGGLCAEGKTDVVGPSGTGVEGHGIHGLQLDLLGQQHSPGC